MTTRDPLSHRDLIDANLTLQRNLETMRQNLEAANAELAVLKIHLKEALERVVEHGEGCLYCGGDVEYVEEHGECSDLHLKSCWYYKALTATERKDQNEHQAKEAQRA